jgi:hypothetical protein
LKWGSIRAVARHDDLICGESGGVGFGQTKMKGSKSWELLRSAVIVSASAIEVNAKKIIC